jgi:hypothetical protein
MQFKNREKEALHCEDSEVSHSLTSPNSKVSANSIAKSNHKKKY